VANPKQAFNATNPAQIPKHIFLHRVEKMYDMGHNPINTTPTIRTNAADMSDNNSIINVIDPIAITTKEKITGASPSYYQPNIRRGGIQSIQFLTLSKSIVSMDAVLKSFEVARLVVGKAILLLLSSSYVHDHPSLLKYSSSFQTVWPLFLQTRKDGVRAYQRDFTLCVDALGAKPLLYDCLWVRAPHWKLDLFILRDLPCALLSRQRPIN
jgi:hypothetical protein